MILLVLVSMLFAAALVPQAPGVSPPAIDGNALRSIAAEAVAGSNGDDDAALRAMDEKVRARWGDVLTGPLSISDAPTEIHLFSPYAAYRKSVAELLKRKQPIDRLAFNPVGIVVVAPARVDAPDVTGIRLQRNGQDVEAVTNQLILRPITSPMGVTLNLHAGYVAFPLSSFAPGADVVVTALVDSGSPVVFPIDAALLPRFR